MDFWSLMHCHHAQIELALQVAPMPDNVVPYDKYYRLRKRQQELRAAEAPDANFQAHVFLQLCEAGFLPRTQLANVASYLPLPALIVLKGLLKER